MSYPIGTAATCGHICQLSNGPVAHVGGPAIGGDLRCRAQGQPVLRVGDKVLCTSPAPASILNGSSKVRVGGRLVALVGKSETDHNTHLQGGGNRIKIGK